MTGTRDSADSPAPALPPDAVRQLLVRVLERPAPEGARLVVRGWLDQLREAMTRWEARGSADALHDVRVAVRRLRAVQAALAPLLTGSTPGRVRRALRRVARATGALRTLHVQRAWLRAEVEGLAPPVRLEAEALVAALDEAVPRARRRAARALSRAQEALAGWEERLDTMPVRLRVGRPTIGAPYARALSMALAAEREPLAGALDTLASGAGNEPPLATEHALRVLFKGQRALLAAAAAADRAVAGWHEAATRGQELLGAVRDAALLARRARAAGADGVAAALDAVARAHRDAFAMGFVERRGEVLAAFDGAVAWLRGAAPPVTPAGVPVEVERKYLLHALPPDAAAVPPAHITQGWLPGTALRERLRRTVRPDGTEALTRTVKLGPAAARLEVEEAVEGGLFDALWALTAAARVAKRRHTVVTDGVAWEVDDFADRTLVLAEVECEGEEAVPSPPAWLAPYIDRDVTAEPEFTNAALARPAQPPPAC